MSIVGTNSSDVWCGGATTLRHWDGSAWTLVPVPLPTSNAPLESQGQLATAGPGAVWIATSYGVARVDAHGPAQSFVGGGDKIAQSGRDVFLLKGTTLLTLRNGTLAPATSAPAMQWGNLDAHGGALWLYGADDSTWRSEVARFDGTAWSTGTLQGWDSEGRFQLPTISAGVFWSPISVGVLDPPWMHPDRPPLHDVIETGWQFFRWDGTAAPSLVKVPVPADIPRDGSVYYAGVRVIPSNNGRLAVLACITPAPNSGKLPHSVIHEFDGSAFVAPREVPFSCPRDEGTWPALDDGTWFYTEDFKILLNAP